MPVDIDKLWVFRIIHIQNLEHNLLNGLYCKSAGVIDPLYLGIGSKEIINRRDIAVVKCAPNTVVNDYVPFYFSVRTPMLYNIVTGHGVPRINQEEIIYLCCRLNDVANDELDWCYTNGNAAAAITKFYKSLVNIQNNIDWHSIRTTDFRDNNADGDEDRVRKKHAEFLVKDHVPVKYISSIVVLNAQKQKQVETIISNLKLRIEVHVNPQNKFYF